MAKYINLEELMKFPIRRNHYDKEHGNEDFICGIETVLEYAEKLPATENGVTVQEWISVKDRLPEQGEEAICIAADGDMMIGKYTEWGWMFPCYFEELTHWMPIPEPPKGE